MPAAAVVIPTRNRRAALERAIGSVRAQSLDDWELIVVDDASTDDTWELLAGLEDARIRPRLLDRHRERSAARNAGLALVSAPAVLFLDDDDELLPSSLHVLTAALAREPAACASVGAAIHEADGMRRRPSFPGRPQLLDVRLELLAGWVALGGQTLFRTALIRELGGWDERLSVAEDQELWLRLSLSRPAAIVPDAVLLHRPHGLAGDAPDGLEVERGVIADHLATTPPGASRAARAAAAREHLRAAYLRVEEGNFRASLRASVSGVRTAPFLLRSPLVGPGIRRGLAATTVGALLPPFVAGRLRAAVRRRRSVDTKAGQP